MTTTHTGSPDLRVKLSAVEDDLSQLRTDRALAARTRDHAKTAFAAIEGYDTNSAEYRDAVEKARALGDIEDKISSAQAAQVGMLKMLGAGGDTERSNSTPTGGDRHWDTAGVLKDQTVRGRLQQMASTTMPIGRLALGQVADRDTLKADVTGTSNMRRGAFAGVVPQLRRQLRILDLIPTGVMDQNTLPYTVESGSFETARETAEGALKPEAEVVFTDATADATTIAHWTKMRKQSLADLPALQSVIDGRLRYGVENRLQDEILAGNGTGDNMRGILATTGVGVVPYVADALVADQLLTGITNIFLNDAEADAVVVHPLDWSAVLSAKATGDGHYFSGGPFQVTPQVIWGVPLIPSAAVPQGTALVGDFSIGVQLFIREGVNVLLSDADQDDFIRNRVTLLAEMRAALAVFRPSAFVTVALAT
jgi:HK97 family phage major capsid protein